MRTKFREQLFSIGINGGSMLDMLVLCLSSLPMKQHQYIVNHFSSDAARTGMHLLPSAGWWTDEIMKMTKLEIDE